MKIESLNHAFISCIVLLLLSSLEINSQQTEDIKKSDNDDGGIITTQEDVNQQSSSSNSDSVTSPTELLASEQQPTLQSRSDLDVPFESTTTENLFTLSKTPTILHEADNPYAFDSPVSRYSNTEFEETTPGDPNVPFNVYGAHPKWLQRGHHQRFRGLLGRHLSKGSEDNDRFNSAVGYPSGNGNGETNTNINGKPQHHSNKKGLVNPIQTIMTKFALKNALVHGIREVKDDYHRKEYQRKIQKVSDKSGDSMTRIMRNILQKLINKYEKNTATLDMLVGHRKEKLKYFLDMPLVKNILKSTSRTPQNLPGELGSYGEGLDTSSGPGGYARKDDAANADVAESQQQEDLVKPLDLLTPILDIGRKFFKFIDDVIMNK